MPRTESLRRGGEPCEHCGGWLFLDGAHETIEEGERCHDARVVAKLRRDYRASQTTEADLRAEVDRLKAELAKQIEVYNKDVCDVHASGADTRSELRNLRAEVNRLRAALAYVTGQRDELAANVTAREAGRVPERNSRGSDGDCG